MIHLLNTGYPFTCTLLEDGYYCSVGLLECLSVAASLHLKNEVHLHRTKRLFNVRIK